MLTTLDNRRAASLAPVLGRLFNRRVEGYRGDAGGASVWLAGDRDPSYLLVKCTVEDQQGIYIKWSCDLWRIEFTRLKLNTKEVFIFSGIVVYSKGE